LFGSAASVRREKSGGHRADGSSLQKGDKLPFLPLGAAKTRSGMHQTRAAKAIGSASQFIHHHRKDFEGRARHSQQPIALIPGYQWDNFDILQRVKLLNQSFTVTGSCDRMGIRLQSQTLLTNNRKLLSQGLCNGAVQCAGDGQLIIMLNDRQTIGGYPVLGAVEAFSRARLAQLRPNTALTFVVTDALTVASRQTIWHQQLRNLSDAVETALTS
jgi:allophanate hydrolase subunit 2